MKAIEFYEANKTTVIKVPRPDHPEDPSGRAGVAPATEARFFAANCPVMSLSDACEFAEKYAAKLRSALENYRDAKKIAGKIEQAQAEVIDILEAQLGIYTESRNPDVPLTCYFCGRHVPAAFQQCADCKQAAESK